MSNDQYITLTADEKEVCTQTLKTTALAIHQLRESITKDTLTNEIKETIPQLIEYHMSELSRIIGFDSLSAEKVEEKHAEIRRANTRVRELEEKLASDQPIDGLKEQIKGLANVFQKWWKAYGFGYIEQMNFTQFGVFEVELGISFFRSSTFSKKPISDRQTKSDWIQSLHEQGYHIFEDGSIGDKSLIDCPENKELLTKLLEEQFPSVFIEGWTTRRIMEAEGHLYEIRRIKIDITDLKEIQALTKYFPTEEEGI